MNRIRATILSLALAVLLPGFALGDTTVVNPSNGVATWPAVTFPATGLTLTYTAGTIYVGTSSVAIVSGTLSLTDTKNTCTIAAIQGGTDACNYVYFTTGTALSTSTTFSTATAAGNMLLYLCNTTGGNITKCLPAPVLKGLVAPGALAAVTGTGSVVLATSPTLVTPTLGAATATTLNGNTFTTGTYTLTGTAAKTLTFSNSLTLAGTDSTTMTFPTTSATIARTDAANTFTGHQTIEGVTSTGATGTGKLVFDTASTLNQPVVNGGTTAVGATLSPTCAAQSGQTIFLGATTGEVVTLPTPATGCRFRFIITVTNTSNSNEIQTAASQFLLGSVNEAASAGAVSSFWADGTSTRAFKCNGTTTGGLIGSVIDVEGTSSTVWAISGTNLASGAIATPFTGTP